MYVVQRDQTQELQKILYTEIYVATAASTD